MTFSEFIFAIHNLCECAHARACVCVVLGLEPGALGMLGKHCELNYIPSPISQPLNTLKCTSKTNGDQGLVQNIKKKHKL